LKAGPLGQFKLPVTITPASNTIFFIDPRTDGIGNDNFPGTAARPWRSVENALKLTETTGSRVALVASAGNDVVVTILAGGTEGAAAINTPNLPAGSVTVLKAPSAGTFTLNMGGNQLTLNKGYKLQGIKITSNVGGSTTIPRAVKITDPTAGLASVDVECTPSSSSKVYCVEVAGAGSHTLRDVSVGVKDTDSANIGILIDANATLSIVGGKVRVTDNTNSITLIQADGVLTATGLTVDMTNSGGTAHTQNSTGIVLNAAGSSVTGSTIKMNKGASGGDAIGIDVLGNAQPSTVEGNTFNASSLGAGNAIGIMNGGRLSPNPLLRNTFVGFTGANDKKVVF
jgi:hypothetical protein